MAKGASANEKKFSLKRMFKSIGKFFKDCKSEMKKIVWFSRKQTIRSTILVIVVLVVCSAIICTLDFGFSNGLVALGKLI